MLTDQTSSASRARRSCAGLFACALLLANVCEAQTTSRAREAKPIPAGEVVVTLTEQTFNALIEALFTLPQPPTFPLGGAARGGGECPGEISLAREIAGTRTMVRFREGRVTAPVAFRGSYNAPVFGCLRFEGWADTALNLAFDPAKQALTARVEVREVHLSKVPSVFNNGVTGLVQDSLDARVNPVEILRAEQVSAQLPLKKISSGGSLRLRAREVRHEIIGAELRLRIFYEFVRED
ncbi:MAG: hypothetical protein LC785_11955 [Acidobacteria bacterium]|nr:hypothetical protein [Acidobacteriota bacterium]MCA1642635.1 hypothetical protein [Acidobacteriota bacterium]